jgi:hypothetical protein
VATFAEARKFAALIFPIGPAKTNSVLMVKPCALTAKRLVNAEPRLGCAPVIMTLSSVCGGGRNRTLFAWGDLYASAHTAQKANSASAALKMPKSYEFLALFVPQAKSQRFATGKQGDRLNARKEGIRVMAALQMVVGNTRAQVVDVMEADIPGKPL